MMSDLTKSAKCYTFIGIAYREYQLDIQLIPNFSTVHCSAGSTAVHSGHVRTQLVTSKMVRSFLSSMV